MNIKCSMCKWYKKSTKFHGECRRFPPSILTAIYTKDRHSHQCIVPTKDNYSKEYDTERYRGIVPIVRHDCYCGEFIKK